MAKQLKLTSRVIDYVWYVAIGLALVGFSVFVAFLVDDSDTAVQVGTVFAGVCIASAFLIAQLWRRKSHGSLLLYTAAAAFVHCAVWGLIYREIGTISVYAWGSAIVIELAVLVTLGEKILPAKRARAGRI
jgi:hypothetical protein